MQRSGTSSAIRYGLAFESALAVLGILIGVTSEYGSTLHSVDGGLRLASCVMSLAFIGLIVEAGHFAAVRTGQVGTSAVAGGLTGFCGAVSFSLVIVSATMLRHPDMYKGIHSVVIGLFVAIFLTGSCLFGIGLGLGALGGLIGRARFHRAPGQTQ